MEEETGDFQGMDFVETNDDVSTGGGNIDFDAVEQPLELELGSEGILVGDDEEEPEDYIGGVSDEGEAQGEDSGQEFQVDAGEDASALETYGWFKWMNYHCNRSAAQKRPFLQQHASRTPNKRPREEQDDVAKFEELMVSLNRHERKRARRNEPKHRGRRKGSKNKLNPEVDRKLGDATNHYAHDRYEEAFRLLKDVIRLEPKLYAPYHLLGKIYFRIGDNRSALDCYMIAAHLSPKETSLWKILISESLEQGDKSQANYCLNKAISADPEDTDLLYSRASLYEDVGDLHKAAQTYERIFNLCPDETDLLFKATQLYNNCGQWQLAVNMLEGYLKNHLHADILCGVNLIYPILMEHNEYARALDHIQLTCGASEVIPVDLSIKAGICHAHLGNLEMAEEYFKELNQEKVSSDPGIIGEVADELMVIGQFEHSLKYYLMFKEIANDNNGYLDLRIAWCYTSLGQRTKSIEYYYTASQNLENNMPSLLIDAKLALSSLLIEEDRSDEAIAVLSPPSESDLLPATASAPSKLWWHNGKIKLKLSQIYKAKGSVEDFVDALFPIIRETMHLETAQQKLKMRKRLSRSVLTERVKVLDDMQSDNLFKGFRPVASSSDLCKAARAKKLLAKKAAEKEAKKAAAMENGFDWYSDDSDDDSLKSFRKPPLPEFLKDEGNHVLILELCKSLASLGRYWDALEIINLSLKLECNALPKLTKEELRTLGAQMAYNLSDPAHGWEYVRYVVSHRPYSLSAWNFYYKGILRSNRFFKHKFLHSIRLKHKDSVPPILISGHQFAMISQHQAAAREYLEAYKLMPDNPLISLCAGTALINLALGFRLQNKLQTLLQGLAFLHTNLRLCENSQEALYNIARAYHHVGLVSFAVKYYEKVLAIHPQDCPIPRLPNENAPPSPKASSGYCDLRREAAYNLHLIYKKSGALDLARQVLKDHVNL